MKAIFATSKMRLRSLGALSLETLPYWPRPAQLILLLSLLSLFWVGAWHWYWKGQFSTLALLTEQSTAALSVAATPVAATSPSEPVQLIKGANQQQAVLQALRLLAKETGVEQKDLKLDGTQASTAVVGPWEKVRTYLTLLGTGRVGLEMQKLHLQRYQKQSGHVLAQIDFVFKGLFSATSLASTKPLLSSGSSNLPFVAPAWELAAASGPESSIPPTPSKPVLASNPEAALKLPVGAASVPAQSNTGGTNSTEAAPLTRTALAPLPLPPLLPPIQMPGSATTLLGQKSSIGATLVHKPTPVEQNPLVAQTQANKALTPQGDTIALQGIVHRAGNAFALLKINDDALAIIGQGEAVGQSGVRLLSLGTDRVTLGRRSLVPELRSRDRSGLKQSMVAPALVQEDMKEAVYELVLAP